MIIGKHIICAYAARYVRFMIILDFNWIKMIVLTNGRLGQGMMFAKTLMLSWFVWSEFHFLFIDVKYVIIMYLVLVLINRRLINFCFCKTIDCKCHLSE